MKIPPNWEKAELHGRANLCVDSSLISPLIGSATSDALPMSTFSSFSFSIFASPSGAVELDPVALSSSAVSLGDSSKMFTFSSVPESTTFVGAAAAAAAAVLFSMF